MPLIPHPDSAAGAALKPLLSPVVQEARAAAGNVAHKVLYGGVADLRPMPRTLIDDGTLREVYHYRPLPGVVEAGDPVLLVTPLAAPALCYDLRRGCSVVEHLLCTGRPTYLVEYGEVSFANRSLGIEHWIEEAVPQAIREVSANAGGRPVHVVGWSLAGIFALLVAADDTDLPIASLSVLGSPFDVTQVPLVAPLRPLVDLADGRIITALYQALGGAPKPFVRWAFQLSAVDKLLTKPVAKLTHLADTDFLAQLEAVDRFTENLIAYPGRTFGQLYHRFFRTNALRTGRVDLGDRTIDVADVRVPVLVVAGAGDGIAPIGAVKAVLPLLGNAKEARFDIVPGGHLGLLTGRAARATTWPLLDRWFADHETA
ncbi:alpha/beta fold hydrolase [Nocardioides cheoyonin]|uniref:alpha/beta fold hydrolase n=1 Tax=Nocardioides cheoyonin TaxID=3156615 RepID=UPI0032B598D5